MRCSAPRGTLRNAEKGMYIACPCGRWNCPGCARRKGEKIASRLASLKPDFFVTLDLDHHAWAIPANARELQSKMRSLLRWMDRQRWVDGYAWVNEAGAKSLLCQSCGLLRRSRRDDREGCRCAASVLVEACICARAVLRGCICGAGGENLHRHFTFRVGAGGRNRYGRPFFPWERLHVAARRLGLVVSDIRPVFSHGGVGQYMAKFAGYLAKSCDSPLHAPVGEMRVVGYHNSVRSVVSDFKPLPSAAIHDDGGRIIDRKVRRSWHEVRAFVPENTRRYGFSQEVPPAPTVGGWAWYSGSIDEVVLRCEGFSIVDAATGEVPQFFAHSSPS